MDDSLRAQIYNNLSLRETEDLLEIWQDKNLEEYEQESFDIIQQILSERLGSAFNLQTKTFDHLNS